MQRGQSAPPPSLGSAVLTRNVHVQLQPPHWLYRLRTDLRTARTGYAYQPPAYQTHLRRLPPGPMQHCTYDAIRVPALGVPCVRRAVAPQPPPLRNGVITSVP